MDDKNRFLDFPIALLRGFLSNPDESLLNIYCYSVFKLVYSEESVFDTIGKFSSHYGSRPNAPLITKIETDGGQLYNSFVGSKHVWTGIHIGTWSRYYEKERTEFDLVCLLAFFGLKSICQKSRYKKNVSNDYLMSRMSGFDNKVPIENIDPVVLEYMKNKSKKKRHVFNALEESFKVIRIEKSRGITYSFSMTQKELELEVMKGKFKKSDEFRMAEKKKGKELAKMEFEKWKASLMKSM